MNRQKDPVIWIDTPSIVGTSILGAKAYTLAVLLRVGVPIPHGFCITTEAYADALNPAFTPDVLMNIQRSARLLMALSLSGQLIARSSAIQENDPTGLFPGIFRSVLDIRSETDCIAAIVECLRSSSSERALAYCRLVGAPFKTLRMAVLVQEQIVPVFSGVAFTKSPLKQHEGHSGTLVELVQGHNGRLLSGEPAQGVFFIAGHDSEALVETVHWPDHCVPTEIVDTLRAVHHVCSVIEKALDEGPQDVEWCSDSEGVKILQSRRLPATPAPSPNIRMARSKSKPIVTAPILNGQGEYGLKGAAMMKFAELAWFGKPAAFLKPHTDLEDFLSSLCKIDFGNAGITVRYSLGEEIGLPRRFAPDLESAIQVIRETWKPEWLGIIHGYIDVCDSFELYVDERHCVLEHVPGVWESDSTLAPDVIVIDAASVVIFRVPHTRYAKLLSPRGKSYMTVEPLSTETLEEWMLSIDPYLAKIRDICGAQLPVLCHFVADTAGTRHFLNLRRSGTVALHPSKPQTFHVIRNARDIENWNGEDPLLLQITVDRGNEDLISVIAEKLPRTEGSVFVDFGILSHPAIVLREMGIRPVPAYLSHERVEYKRNNDGPVSV